jgi:hypothetical protein
LIYLSTTIATGSSTSLESLLFIKSNIGMLLAANAKSAPKLTFDDETGDETSFLA